MFFFSLSVYLCECVCVGILRWERGRWVKSSPREREGGVPGCWLYVHAKSLFCRSFHIPLPFIQSSFFVSLRHVLIVMPRLLYLHRWYSICVFSHVEVFYFFGSWSLFPFSESLVQQVSFSFPEILPTIVWCGYEIANTFQLIVYFRK